MNNEMKQNIREIKDEAIEKVQQAAQRAIDASREATERAREAARRADEHVHQDPWKYIGIASLITLIIGFFLGRSSKK